ncbi:hypothetical protein, partial [Halorubrum saccharovorum]|uniref:hypothetical protein n=1 Tax=Halorubrum saccharovorum TaxID=2248 RepID=UPI0019553455
MGRSVVLATRALAPDSGAASGPSPARRTERRSRQDGSGEATGRCSGEETGRCSGEETGRCSGEETGRCSG